MSAILDNTFTKRVTDLLSNILQTVFYENQNETVPPSTSLPQRQTSHEFRRIQLPETRVGLASNEADLIILLRKYLEIVGLVFFVWLFGYLHFSVSWILLAVFIYLFRQRQRTQFKERHRMLNEINTNEEQYIKARLDELPSWVFFPDIERAEWVNRMIKQAWPFANQFLDKTVFRETLIPFIRTASGALADFSFQKLDLGEIPPRIGGIKVYSDNVRDQIMMDIEVFYAGDAHIKTKVKGIVCGIKDIQLIGDLRIILSPLINTIPLVGAVTFFFLKTPNIDFKLTNAGTLVELPVLNDLMLSQVRSVIASMMVLPNRQVIPLVSDIDIGHLRLPNPQGVVRVFIIQARDLIKADLNIFGGGKSDPFVRVKGNVEYRTKTIRNSTDPEWNEVFEFVVEQYESENIEFDVFDEDPGKNDFIGRAQFPLSALIGKDLVDTWLTLKDVKKGSLNVRLQYFNLVNEHEALETIERINNNSIKREKISQALLVCYIDRCTNLPFSKKNREPNPFCRMKVDTSECVTATLESRTNPDFKHVSQFFCSNPLQQRLLIEVCDARTNNEVIGFFEIPIKQIFDAESMNIEMQPFSLRSISEPLERVTIELRLSLFVLAPQISVQKRPAQSSPSLNSVKSFDTRELRPNTSKEEQNGKINRTASSTVESKKTLLVCDDPDLLSSQFGQIQLGIQYSISRNAFCVTIISCRNLMKVHAQNLPDPYIRLCLLPAFKKEKKKTRAIHDTVEPVYGDLFEWNESLLDVKRQQLYISVKNDSPLFAQEQVYMGDLRIDLSNLDPEKSSVAWYSLQQPKTSSATIMKIKYDRGELKNSQ